MEKAGADVVKIAVMPRELRDVLALLDATLTAQSTVSVPVISMSMGGFGSLHYAQQHADEVDAVAVFAPYLGSRRLGEEIVALEERYVGMGYGDLKKDLAELTALLDHPDRCGGPLPEHYAQ